MMVDMCIGALDIGNSTSSLTDGSKRFEITAASAIGSRQQTWLVASQLTTSHGSMMKCSSGVMDTKQLIPNDPLVFTQVIIPGSR
jgi:hypothetical protein